jgi:hypothetical protein
MARIVQLTRLSPREAPGMRGAGIPLHPTDTALDAIAALLAVGAVPQTYGALAAA